VIWLLVCVYLGAHTRYQIVIVIGDIQMVGRVPKWLHSVGQLVECSERINNASGEGADCLSSCHN